MLASRIALRGVRVAAPRFSIVASRGFAEEKQAQQSKSSANSAPPVEVYGLDGTYASALYTAAVKNQTLDNISKAMDTLSRAFKQDTNLTHILSAPTLSMSDKQSIAAELQKQAGVQDKNNTLKNFLETLAENNRLSVLEGVCEKFGVLMSAARGEVEMTITSAAPLDQKVVRQLEQAVSKSNYVGKDKKLKVVPKVNPDIRGGLIVEVGDRTIDLSVSSKMARMDKLLREQL